MLSLSKDLEERREPVRQPVVDDGVRPTVMVWRTRGRSATSSTSVIITGVRLKRWRSVWMLYNAQAPRNDTPRGEHTLPLAARLCQKTARVPLSWGVCSAFVQSEVSLDQSIIFCVSADPEPQ